MVQVGDINVTGHAFELTIKSIVLSLLIGGVAVVLMQYNPIIIFFWGVFGTFATTYLVLDQADKLTDQKMGEYHDNYHSDQSFGSSNQGSQGSSTGSSSEKTPLSWESDPSYDFKHRPVDARSRGILVEVSDGDKNGEFFLQDNGVKPESPIVENKHGEDWVEDARSYLKDQRRT